MFHVVTDTGWKSQGFGTWGEAMMYVRTQCGNAPNPRVVKEDSHA